MPRHALALAHVNAHKHQRKRLQPAHIVIFVRRHAGDAKAISASTGVPAEVILAQSALETNWGRTVKGNAYFGIKGKSPAGKSTTFATHEVKSGKSVGEVDEFRAYASYSESAKDYAFLIQQKYALAMVYRKDPEKFAEAVAQHGYATDPRYAEKLKSIIHSHIHPLLNK